MAIKLRQHITRRFRQHAANRQQCAVKPEGFCSRCCQTSCKYNITPTAQILSLKRPTNKVRIMGCKDYERDDFIPSLF